MIVDMAQARRAETWVGIEVTGATEIEVIKGTTEWIVLFPQPLIGVELVIDRRGAARLVELLAPHEQPGRGR